MTSEMNLDTEEWRPIVGFEGRYEVSSMGRVRSVDRTVTHRSGAIEYRPALILKPRPHRQGYVTARIYLPGTIYREVMVHILVAEAFIGPRPVGMDVCHSNDIKDDNRPENLRYGTRSENVSDSVRNGTHPQSSKTHCKHGHEFTETNTYVAKRGAGLARHCRTCNRLRMALNRMEKAMADA